MCCPKVEAILWLASLLGTWFSEPDLREDKTNEEANSITKKNINLEWCSQSEANSSRNTICKIKMSYRRQLKIMEAYRKLSAQISLLALAENSAKGQRVFSYLMRNDL